MVFLPSVQMYLCHFSKIVMAVSNMMQYSILDRRPEQWFEFFAENRRCPLSLVVPLQMAY